MRAPPRTWLFAAALILAAGCKNESEPGYYGTLARHGHSPRTLYINNGDEPEYLDPGLISEQAGGCLAFDLFEGLVEQHPADLHPVQGVAERYDKSDDNRIFRCYLREDAKWSDGKPVTAADFVYAWQRVLRPETGSRQVGMMYALKNGEAFGARKLLVTSRAVVLQPSRHAKDGKTIVLEGSAVRLLGKPEGGMVEVELYDDLPTFRPRPRAVAKAPEKGWVELASLQLDESVIGVRAASERVLEVELEQPTPYFLELASYYAFFPVRRDVIERAAWRG